MRSFGFLLKNATSLHEPRIPGPRLARINQSYRRRLDDGVEEVFHRACATNDLEAAADLLTVMEKWHERRAAKFGRDRRIDEAALQRARRELERLITQRSNRLAQVA